MTTGAKKAEHWHILLIYCIVEDEHSHIKHIEKYTSIYSFSIPNPSITLSPSKRTMYLALCLQPPYRKLKCHFIFILKATTSCRLERLSLTWERVCPGTSAPSDITMMWLPASYSFKDGLFLCSGQHKCIFFVIGEVFLHKLGQKVETKL